ncbi:hypothetical protein HanHA300_Chr02g0041001 [Helianthus annuus]|nr:hypothetical protein HanHA300_Chr02g0041001 [Helianthus annuus]KAJ0617654.1 hypothetical protein HanHA89_Chr02g0044221 [Helianthus annuus]KAJ0776192.1 hypothetical protein HanLR1_Chr02g0042771 [Helianthus annuus]
MNEHEHRSRLFIYVREHSVMCSFVFNNSLVFLVFIFYLNTSRFRQIKYLVSISILILIFIFYLKTSQFRQ